MAEPRCVVLAYGFVVRPRTELSIPQKTYPHKNPMIWGDRWCSWVLLVRGVLVAAW